MRQTCGEGRGNIKTIKQKHDQPSINSPPAEPLLNSFVSIIIDVSLKDGILLFFFLIFAETNQAYLF